MGQIDVILTEITTDPLVVGYSGMSDEAVAVSLNSTATGRTLPVDTLTAAQIYEAIDTAEFDALTDAQRTGLDRILSLGGDILVTPTSKARAIVLAAFGGGTATRDALIAEVTRTVSRATELGLATVKAGHVEEARRQ